MLVCAKESAPAAGQGLQHQLPARSRASTPELTKCPNPAPGSFHTTYMNICTCTGTRGGHFCLCGHWLPCCSAQMCDSTRMPSVCLCAYWEYRLTLLRIEHCGMESQQTCFHQASKFSSPLTSCNNLCTPTANTEFFFFFLLYGLQLDAMLNWEKNSLQTHIHCYVSPIFNQAER